MGDIPNRKYFDFRPSEVAFGAVLGVNSKLDDQQPLCLKPLNVWLRFAPARRGKNLLASYYMYSFSRCSVELRDTNTNCVSPDP